jgi:hypothetical protein
MAHDSVGDVASTRGESESMAPPPPWDPVSIAALIFAILGGLLGFAFGVIGLILTSRRRRRGRGLAVAAVIISVGWFLVICAFVVATAFLGERISAPAQSLDVGDCVATSEHFAATPTVLTTDCAAPHLYEVFVTYDLVGEEDWNESRIEDLATQGCVDRMAGLAERQGVDTTSLQVTSLRPSRQSWTEDGDRRVACLLHRTDGADLIGDPLLS